MWEGVTGVGTDRLGHRTGICQTERRRDKSGVLGQGSTWHNVEGLMCMSAHCSKGDPGPRAPGPGVQSGTGKTHAS